MAIIVEARLLLGIPGIRLYPTDLDLEELAEEAKGWLLFEESQPTSTPEDGLRQRRALIEKWATARQEFRESFHNRVAGYTTALDYPAMQTHPRNYIDLVKFLNLLYVHQDEWNGLHPFDLYGAGDASSCHIPELFSSILHTLYLAPADSHAFSMTRNDTVVFADGPDLTWFVIDAPGLATGRLTLAEFGFQRPRPRILGRYLSEIAESGIGGSPQYNEPLDMDLPILELLESTRRANKYKFLYTGYRSRDLWVRIIDQSAPGYLELEAQGREVEFELDDLLVINP
ncbi:hypothetical protein BDV39DRAFT_191107 [Aspergillus sergii]|uniref:Uncharacterized protein n=1 Tax=Aspergillus sergii TaxID=1034303 RepID=A0A5N6X998_9EURO|nr:hypothetical protein BDV39DRAFT_191107 [Aspergillus sergii]